MARKLLERTQIFKEYFTVEQDRSSMLGYMTTCDL